MKTIVVGYDESAESLRALHRAAELAQALDAKLVVTSIAPIMAAGPRSIGPEDPTDSVQKHETELARAQEYLAGYTGVEAEFVTGLADPADGLVQIADDRDADLIVVGTHERGMLQRLLGQSVSDAVAHRAHRDVLIVHPEH